MRRRRFAQTSKCIVIDITIKLIVILFLHQCKNEETDRLSCIISNDFCFQLKVPIENVNV